MEQGVTTRNIRACPCQCVQAAREMHLPLRTALDVFEGEPTKTLLAMTQRVQELELEAAQENRDFDPVRYVTGAAKRRGWGKYAERKSVTLDLSSIEEETLGQIREMVEDAESVGVFEDFLTHAAQIYAERKALRNGDYAEVS